MAAGLPPLAPVAPFARFALERVRTPPPPARPVASGPDRHVHRRPVSVAVVAALTGQGLPPARPALIGHASGGRLPTWGFARRHEEEPLGGTLETARAGNPWWIKTSATTGGDAMPGGNGGNEHEERPETALEEVLREVEEAEKRDEAKASRGEAGDAITPNTAAQEQAGGE
ncbi:hypothetical protein [Streptomyces sp. NPDC001135]